MAGNRDLVEIVHSRPAEMPVRHRKPRRLNDMGGDVQAGAEAQDGARVLGDIGLIKGEVHSRSGSIGANRSCGSGSRSFDRRQEAWNQWPEIGQSVCLGLKHNNGDRESMQILLKGQVPVDCHEYIKVLRCEASASSAPFLMAVQSIWRAVLTS